MPSEVTADEAPGASLPALSCPRVGVRFRAMPPDTAFTEAELADVEKWATGRPTCRQPQQANARRMLRLVEEVRWYGAVIASIYHMVPDVPGTEQLRAEP